MTTQNNTLAVQTPPSQSERFTNMVIKEFSSNAGGIIALTDFQKRLVSNYFLSVDKSLKKAELARLEKDERFRDPVSLTWENINMQQLAIDVVSAARVGLDPAQPNHINMIPYKNKHTKKYDVTFVPGYRGKELVVKKYGVDIPDDIIIELVFSNDKFKQIKKDIHNKIEGYEFEVTENFNRGEVVGGFYYYSFFKTPEKNKIRVMSKADIDKRKPKYASVEFWGGEKDVWENGKKTDKKEVIDGYYEEMAWKTVARSAYNNITIDSQKIDTDYLKLLNNETEALSLPEPEQNSGANQKVFAIDNIQTVEEVKEEKPESPPTPPVQETPPSAQGQLFKETNQSKVAPF